jgi:hypothetical protein
MKWLVSLDFWLIAAVIIVPILLSLSLLVTQKRRKLHRAVLVSWGLTHISVLFGPGIFALGWHLRHGMSFPYQDKRIHELHANPV